MLFFLFFIGAVFAVNPSIEDQFKAFMEKYSKKYSSEDEYYKRLGIFAHNIEKAAKKNKIHIEIGGDAVFGITKFSDLTSAEFAAKYLTGKPNEIPDEKRVIPPFDGKLADDVNWVTKGATTRVKDQAFCGSCWAFSAVEALESYAYLSGKWNLTDLSTQQVVSCDILHGDQACQGGYTEHAFNYIKRNGGLTANKNYPYTSKDGGRHACKKTKEKEIVVGPITGYTAVAKGEAALKTALNSGPASICLAADSWSDYKGGILKKCPGEVDHCVQAVGYNTAENYWLVRNSWATDWGEKGFIRLEMGKDLCNVSDDTTFPTFS